jgi:hypothetical protein
VKHNFHGVFLLPLTWPRWAACWSSPATTHLFASPGVAAVALMGRSANGWVEWKAANCRTLD